MKLLTGKQVPDVIRKTWACGALVLPVLKACQSAHKFMPASQPTAIAAAVIASAAVVAR